MIYPFYTPPFAERSKPTSAVMGTVVILILPILFSSVAIALNYGGALPQGQTVISSTIAKGVLSGIGVPRYLVIRERADWEKLWAEHTSIFIPPPPLPPVDFSSDMAVAVYSGEKPTGGFSMEIHEVRRTKIGLVVRYVENGPRPGVIAASVLTQPFHIIRLARAPEPVDFELISETK